MTRLYLIRHGESEANRRHAFLGHGDLPLTDRGREQAAATASYLADLLPDVIYASDLSRAYGTAEATASRLGIPILATEELREINAGVWENRAIEDIIREYPETYAVWKQNFGLSCPDGGERVADLRARAVAAVTRIAEKEAGKCVFLFSHAAYIRSFISHVMGLSLADMREIGFPPNASVTEVTYENGTFSLINYGYDAFMPDDLKERKKT